MLYELNFMGQSLPLLPNKRLFSGNLFRRHETNRDSRPLITKLAHLTPVMFAGNVLVGPICK